MQIDADSYDHVRYQATTEIRQSAPHGVDKNLNLDSLMKGDDLMKLTGSFDILKHAIEHLLSRQNDQSILINELLEASKDGNYPAFTVIEQEDVNLGDDKSSKSSKSALSIKSGIKSPAPGTNAQGNIKSGVTSPKTV